MNMRFRNADSGLTLLELVVAMSIFALVAVMGMQSLTGTLRLRNDLAARAVATAELTHGLTILRRDMANAVPLLFYAPGGAPPRSAIDFPPGGRRLALSVGGRALLPGEAGSGGGLGRVEYRIDEDRLLRRLWPVPYPLDNTQAGPEVEILRGVTGLNLRSYWRGQGWVPGARPNADDPDTAPVPDNGVSLDEDRSLAVPEVYSSALPMAVELTLSMADYGALVLLETLQ